MKNKKENSFLFPFWAMVNARDKFSMDLTVLPSLGIWGWLGQVCDGGDRGVRRK